MRRMVEISGRKPTKIMFIKKQSHFKLTYIGRDCIKIPPILCKLYGAKAVRLDLSYNFVDKLDGLETFIKLEELILDNNILEDGTQFPPNKGLLALSLNKNKVSANVVICKLIQ